MSNPYSVLGISESATDEEVKNAYRELAKKYHPDNYENSELADFASEKMKEINLAYDTIIEERRNKRKNSDGVYASTGYSSEYPDVRRLINNNRVADAEQILDGIPRDKRSAEWYFLKSMVFYKKGFLEDAFSYIETACQMDSENKEYQSAYNHIKNARNGEYGGYNVKKNGSMPMCSCCDLCNILVCSDCCSECFGGDLIGCC